MVLKAVLHQILLIKQIFIISLSSHRRTAVTRDRVWHMLCPIFLLYPGVPGHLPFDKVALISEYRLIACSLWIRNWSYINIYTLKCIYVHRGNTIWIRIIQKIRTKYCLQKHVVYEDNEIKHLQERPPKPEKTGNISVNWKLYVKEFCGSSGDLPLALLWRSILLLVRAYCWGWCSISFLALMLMILQKVPWALGECPRREKVEVCCGMSLFRPVLVEEGGTGIEGKV